MQSIAFKQYIDHNIIYTTNYSFHVKTILNLYEVNMIDININANTHMNR